MLTESRKDLLVKRADEIARSKKKHRLAMALIALSSAAGAGSGHYLAKALSKKYPKLPRAFGPMAMAALLPAAAFAATSKLRKKQHEERMLGK